MYLLLIDKSVI